MDINEFTRKRPYLYHLTHQNNTDNIIANGCILSTSKIIERSEIEDKKQFLRERRDMHTRISISGQEYHIRDQRPIFPKALKKCVTEDWDSGDFIEHLNKRVFFWATLKRLQSHYGRYSEENPIIVKVNTASLIKVNAENPPKFCRLNSGATRPNPHLGGVAPSRGADTFKEAENYDRIVSSVVEVTFETICELPDEIEIATKPDGPWKSIDI